MGERERSGAATVEGPLERDEPGPAGAARQFDRSLDRLGAAVGEEDRRPFRRLREAKQALGELDLGPWVKKLETCSASPACLLTADTTADGCAQGVDRDTAEEVEVALAVDVPDQQPSPRSSTSAGRPKTPSTACA